MKFSHILLALYFVLFVVCAVEPYSRAVWVAENVPIVALIVVLVLIGRGHSFSRMSLLFMAVLPFLHTIGGHFTFERVPFAWVTELFGFERNHYDRVAHFSVGFYAFPIAEFVMAKGYSHSRLFACLFGVFCIFTVASLYEIIEWQYAMYADPSAGVAVLGSQGDVWDAQKDMFADGLGALLAAGVFYCSYRRSAQRLRG